MPKPMLERYEEAHAAFMNGGLDTHSDEQLITYLSGLSNQNNTNTGTQHRDVIRGLTINNILLKRHIDKLQAHISRLNDQNTKTQYLVIALTIASLIGTAAQIWYAYRADSKADPPSARVAEPAFVQQQVHGIPLPPTKASSPTIGSSAAGTK